MFLTDRVVLEECVLLFPSLEACDTHHPAQLKPRHSTGHTPTHCRDTVTFNLSTNPQSAGKYNLTFGGTNRATNTDTHTHREKLLLPFCSRINSDFNALCWDDVSFSSFCFCFSSFHTLNFVGFLFLHSDSSRRIWSRHMERPSRRSSENLQRPTKITHIHTRAGFLTLFRLAHLDKSQGSPCFSLVHLYFRSCEISTLFPRDRLGRRSRRRHLLHQETAQGRPFLQPLPTARILRNTTYYDGCLVLAPTPRFCAKQFPLQTAQEINLLPSSNLPCT